jgi:ferredoxin
MCWITCPEVFHVSDEDGHAYVPNETVPPELEAQVDQAMRSCPEQAIEIY